MSQTLTLPDGRKRCLLHSCCAPCSGEVMRALQEANIEYTIFFYNPNIHPKEEYMLRKEENIRYAKAHNIPFVDGDYDVETWFKRTEGLAYEPERGKRCTVCFDQRFEVTAAYADAHDFDVITSCLGISRWKDMDQINDCGLRAAEPYPNLIYWTHNWRKQGGSQRMIRIAKRESFYQQEYCGCIYSLRDSNRWRLSQGRPTIQRGQQYYQDDSTTRD